MKIVVDTCGGDFPELIIKGIAQALNEIDGIEIVAFGDQDKINQVLGQEEFDRARLEVVNCTQEICNQDSPVNAIMTKKDSSLVKSYKRLKEDGESVGFISAGSTGAVITGASLLLGRVKGVERPTLLTLLPTLNHKYVCLTDCGANVDCRATQLVQFALLGNAFMKSAYNLESPKVALMSVGTEDEKGNAVSKETFELLKQSGLNFVGNMEGKTLLNGDVDVCVCDGFVGNVALKTVEGATNSTIKIFAEYLKKNADANTDFTFVKKAIGQFMGDYDFNKNGCAMIIGAKKPVMKLHGASVAGAVVYACNQLKNMTNGGLLDKIEQVI